MSAVRPRRRSAASFALDPVRDGQCSFFPRFLPSNICPEPLDFAVTLFLAGALEEFGWRGFAQPRLQERYSAPVGAIIIGVAWGLWHYPCIALGGAGYQESLLTLTIFTTVASVILAGLYNGTQGALPIVMITHALINVMPFLKLQVSFLSGCLLSSLGR